MEKIKKQLNFWRGTIVKRIKRVKIEKPHIEDVFLAFLIIFSLTFSAFLFGIGKQIQETLQMEIKIKSDFEKKVSRMVANHPIETMIPFIVQKDKNVAAYLVAIAKKESNWGIYHPEKNGRECFNYWGYRGSYNQTDSGYSCFRNREQAVNVVGGRIRELLDQNIKTPSEMAIWKCGNTCETHDPESVAKWIEDVDLYYKKTSQLL